MRLIAFLVSLLAVHAAWAQSWPAKPIRLIVGYTTGGAVDAMARPLIAKTAPLLGQQLILEL